MPRGNRRERKSGSETGSGPGRRSSASGLCRLSAQGCSFLCVFGFPGEKEPDEVTHALESAVDIFDFCSQVHKIQ